MQSLKTKGFLRAYRSYTPSQDLLPRFLSCVSRELGVKVDEAAMDDLELLDKDIKFKVLIALSKEFSHSVPNSMLHQMTNISNLYTFYLSPCLLYTSPSPRDGLLSRMPSSA